MTPDTVRVTQKPTVSRQAVRDPISLDALWANPDHWDRLGSYSCPDDPRLFVRDRARVGWTLNMAHRRAQMVIWVFLLAVIGFVTLMAVAAGR
jgi:uncharacterized membrane protein